MTYLEGIDVSHNNGPIDWAKVARSGRKFAFIKATESIGFNDPVFARNRAQAAAHGIAVSPYAFHHFDVSWSDEAHYFATAEGAIKPGELPPMLDLEQDSYRNRTNGISIVDGTRQTLAWLSAIEARFGMPPIIYADRNFILTFLKDPRFAAYPLFLADLSPEPHIPPPWSKVDFWQYSWKGRCPGISGDCDMDRFTGSSVDFQKLVKK